jgi:methyl-branched lipid omega-hydroxylase
MSQTITPMSVDDINLSDPRFWARPLEERDDAFRALREQRPLAFFDEPAIPADSLMDPADLPPARGYYAVTRYADLAEISKNPKDFCSGEGSVSVRDMPPEIAELFGSMIAMDDPRHARIRGIVSRRFTPKALERLLHSVDETAQEILDKAAPKGEIDFVEDIAAPLPLLIICDMMGIPRSEYPSVLHNSNVILSAGDPEYFPPGENPQEILIGAGMSLLGLMNELAEDRRTNPKDDLTTALIHAGEEGEDDRLTPQELSSFFILLVVAGNETTRTALTHGMYQLTRNPDQREILKQDLEGVLPTAVEEIVRYASPVTYMRRTATRDGVQVGGQSFSKGDKFVLFYGSANRDETVFDDPDRFDVRRDPNPHVGFGAPGPHFCLGAHLARREMTVMLRRMFERIPDIEATAEPERLFGALPLVNGIKRLPVRFTPTAAR